jgi:alkanesulfonate monooxygenase SsuD/methylene tetrahydromethanopterin reductase-like flavin-dependent oxidoreductase (luciferase family)
VDVGIIIGEATPLSWDRWRHVVGLVERAGFRSLYRSDHYFNGSQKDSIDPYLGFVMVAEQTTNLRFGPLVSPITFRRPVEVGRMAQQLDALSEGRFVQGLGAGWLVEEHEVYGLDFPSTSERYDRLEEALQLLDELWYSESGHFDGHYYRLNGSDSRPHPPRGRIPVLIGGSGPRRTLPLVARYADEWNATPMSIERYRSANDVLANHCAAIDRDPNDIRRSMLLFTTIGPDQQTTDKITDRFLEMAAPLGTTLTMDDLVAAGRAPFTGSTEQLIDEIGRLGQLGLDEVVFEHFCHEDDQILEWLADEIKPAVEAL